MKNKILKELFNFLKPKKYSIMELLKDENSVEIILKKLEELSGIGENKPVKNFINPLKEAKKYRRLPNTGFLAGGAICNTILSLLDGKKYPINDIDVFIKTKNKDESGYTNRSNKTNIFIGGYGELMTIDSRSESYRICSTERDDIFNYVYVTEPSTEYDEKYLYILNGFDINCCMVGIDLENKKLVYTKDFEDFLKHRQLMISNPYTPAHSALRLLKKKEELNTYLDLDKEFKYLSQLYLLFDNPYQNGMKRVFGNFFSEKYKEMYEKYKDTISEYFDLLTFLDAKIKSQKNINGNNDVPSYLLEIWGQNNHLYTLSPKKFSTPSHFINYIPNSCKGPLSLKKVWDIFERSNKSEINKVRMILENEVTRHFFFAIEDFHKCDFSEKNVEEFESIFSGKDTLIQSIYLAKLNLQESLNFIKIIKSTLTKESTLFVDIIVERIVKDFGNIDKSKFRDKEFIKNIFEEEKTKRSSFLTTPTELSDFEFKNNVYELLTEYDLLFGSRLLHNCMSNPGQGYVSKISKGNCKLFVIETENNYSGVEIEYNLTGYKLKTVLGIANKQACEQHIYIANYLTSFLNHRYWILQSNTIIERLYNNMKIMSDKAKSIDDTKLPDKMLNKLSINRLGGEDFGLNFNFDNNLPILVPGILGQGDNVEDFPF